MVYRKIIFLFFVLLFGNVSMLSAKHSKNIKDSSFIFPAVEISTPFVSIRECIITAEFNNELLKLAIEEKKINKSKRRNSTRNLYPKASIIGEETLGKEDEEYGNPGFKEQSIGMQVSQSIYEGGKLKNTRKHAKIMHEISKVKISSIKNDIIYSVTEAYLNVLKGLLAVSMQKKLLEDIDIYKKMSDDLYGTGNIIKKDFLASKALREQILYQLRTAELEYKKYLWKLYDAMGIKYPLNKNPYLLLSFEIEKIDMDECLKKAEKNNYEILMKKMAVDAAKYQYKVKRSRDIPSFKLEGFYGRSASAYKNEKFKFKEDYQYDVKLEYGFWGNLLSASKAQQKTSAKLGQSSVTQAETASVSIAVLDNLADRIKKKEAKYELNKTEYEYRKVLLDVSNETRETYFNLEKAIIQMKSTEIDLVLARTEFSISKVNFQDSKISIHELMSQRQKITNAKESFFEARIFYLITMAKMKKLTEQETAGVFSVNKKKT